MTKSLLESKTFWIAFAQGFAGVIMVIIEQNPTLAWAMIAKSFIDVVIRLLTDRPASIL